MSTLDTRPPVWFYIVSGLGLIWNLIGVFKYLQQMMLNSDALAAMTEAERAFFESYPAWAAAAFAIAVFGGLIGCILLLLGKKLATSFFWISLVGIVIQAVHSFLLSDTMEIYGPTAVVMPMVILIVALVLLWLSIIAKARGWTS